MPHKISRIKKQYTKTPYIKNQYIKNQWFTLSIVAIFLLSLVFPIGAMLNKIPYISTLATIAIFFLLGINLKSEEILHGFARYRLHLLVQSSVFVIMPAMFWIALHAIDSQISAPIRYGILALACLPTTVSFASTIGLVYGGNVVLTMINSTIANTLGLILSPLLFTIFIGQAGADASALDTLHVVGPRIALLLLKTLPPLVLGQCVRFLRKDFVRTYSKRIPVLCQIIMFVPISIGFATVIAQGSVLLGQSLQILIGLAFVGAMFIVCSALFFLIAHSLRFSQKDFIAYVIIAPQKSMLVGIPIISLYFSDFPDYGLILLPLLFYHPWQIFMVNIIMPFVIKFTNRHQASTKLV